MWLVNRGEKAHTRLPATKKGEHAIVEMMIPSGKVNHSLAITALEANILLLRLWVSLIGSSVPRWDLLQHQDILVMFFQSDCVCLHVLQIQMTPHADAAASPDNDKDSKCFRNSFGACDANCCVYKLSHFQSQGLERSGRGPDEAGAKCLKNFDSEKQQRRAVVTPYPAALGERTAQQGDRGAEKHPALPRSCFFLCLIPLGVASLSLIKRSL